jgi:hypothetical protein
MSLNNNTKTILKEFKFSNNEISRGITTDYGMALRPIDIKNFNNILENSENYTIKNPITAMKTEAVIELKTEVTKSKRNREP